MAAGAQMKGLDLVLGYKSGHGVPVCTPFFFFFNLGQVNALYSGSGGGKKEERERAPPSFLSLVCSLFYFRVRAFSISLNRPSRSLEQARDGITMYTHSGTQGVKTTLFCAGTQDRVPSVDLMGLSTLGT